MAKDLVCGSEVDEAAARAATSQTVGGANVVDEKNGTRRFHEGVWYYFDSLECRSKFMASPEAYIGKA